MLFEMCRFRNAHPAFDGTFELLDSIDSAKAAVQLGDDAEPTDGSGAASGWLAEAGVANNMPERSGAWCGPPLCLATGRDQVWVDRTLNSPVCKASQSCCHACGLACCLAPGTQCAKRFRTAPQHGLVTDRSRKRVTLTTHAFRGLARILAGEELPDDCPEEASDEDAEKFSFDSPAMSGNDVVDLMKSPNSRTAEDEETSLQARPL